MSCPVFQTKISFVVARTAVILHYLPPNNTLCGVEFYYSSAGVNYVHTCGALSFFSGRISKPVDMRLDPKRGLLAGNNERYFGGSTNYVKGSFASLRVHKNVIVGGGNLMDRLYYFIFFLFCFHRETKRKIECIVSLSSLKVVAHEKIKHAVASFRCRLSLVLGFCENVRNLGEKKLSSLIV